MSASLLTRIMPRDTVETPDGTSPPEVVEVDGDLARLAAWDDGRSLLRGASRL